MPNAVALERRITEERMFALDPPGEPPEWLYQFDVEQPLVWTMDAAGNVSPRWTWADAVAWHGVVACRLETRMGKPIDPADLDDDEDWGW